MAHEIINKHGVNVTVRSSGRCFGQHQADGSFKNYIPIFVPDCCYDCQHYDDGEFGDYGEELSGPICGVNLHFPTHKGTCKRQKPH